MGAHQSNQIEGYFGGGEYVGTVVVKQQRLANKDAFVEGIMQFKSKNQDLFLSSYIDKHSVSECASVNPVEKQRLQVIARKRPLNQKEICDNRDFDVVSSSFGGLPMSVHKQSGSDATKKAMIWLHKACFRLDSKHMYLDHHGFLFDRVFDENDSTDDIFNKSVRPNIEAAMSTRFRGGKTSVIMYGATGSGKFDCFMLIIYCC